MTLRLSLEQVHDLARRALAGCGADDMVAGVMADSVRDAEAEGIRNVGLGYLPVYCRHLLCGKVRGDAVAEITQPASAVLCVDAGHGFCHPAYVAAESRFIELARHTGIALLAIRRSYSAGVVGWFNDRLARAGLVSLVFANASSLVAPYGGRQPFFGTNPLGVGAPRPGGTPLVMDLSTSATAYVNVLDAARRGEPIPAGWALDAGGRPTTDAQAAIDGGTIAPLGGYKGTALAIMVDLLAAGVTGGNWSYQSSSFVDDEGGPVGVGQSFIAIAPSATGAGDLAGRLQMMLEAMCTEAGVRVPGQRRHTARREAERHGVELDESLHAELVAFATHDGR